MIIKTPIKTEIRVLWIFISLRLHIRLLIGLNLPVLANYKTDKPEHQQDGSGYHHPIRIFHRREHAQLGTSLLRLQSEFD
jgi:hypothetical protein